MFIVTKASNDEALAILSLPMYARELNLSGLLAEEEAKRDYNLISLGEYKAIFSAKPFNGSPSIVEYHPVCAVNTPQANRCLNLGAVQYLFNSCPSTQAVVTSSALKVINRYCVARGLKLVAKLGNISYYLATRSQFNLTK